MTIRPRRSVLFVPGSNARALEKARGLMADCLIFDLEDAVAPEAKDGARAAVEEALKAGGYEGREIIVRINAAGSQWFADDLAMAARAAPHAILAPKVKGAEDIQLLADRMAGADTGPVALWAMMETPEAVLNARDIAQAARRTPLSVLVMGTNDLALETGARAGENRVLFIPWLMTCVAAAKAHGLEIIDGVYNDFSDAEGFAAECRQGRMMGMSGKSLIHPAQIAAANAAFSPSREEIARAERIVAAFDDPANAGKGVTGVDGRMVERLHLEMARRTLALAAAAGAREEG